MRAVMEAPEGAGYILGDLLVDGNPLEYGGQIAGSSEHNIRQLNIPV